MLVPVTPVTGLLKLGMAPNQCFVCQPSDTHSPHVAAVSWIPSCASLLNRQSPSRAILLGNPYGSGFAYFSAAKRHPSGRGTRYQRRAREPLLKRVGTRSRVLHVFTPCLQDERNVSPPLRMRCTIHNASLSRGTVGIPIECDRQCHPWTRQIAASFTSNYSMY